MSSIRFEGRGSDPRGVPWPSLEMSCIQPQSFQGLGPCLQIESLKTDCAKFKRSAARRRDGAG